MYRNARLVFAFLMIPVFGCGRNGSDEIAAGNPEFITATLPVTAPHPPSGTPVPPSPLPTFPPTAGITTAQINVRSEPSTAGDNLGTIAPFSQVQILGRESFGAWFQILYTTSPDGKGWITAAFVQVEGIGEIPLVETRIGSGSRVNGLALQPLNIRRGPGTNFESLGTLSRNDVVSILGRDANRAWIEIHFKDGTGWVASEFVQADGLQSLPVTADSTEVESESAPPAQATQPAPITGLADGDTQAAPVAAIHLSPAGTRAARFTGRLSASAGDLEDWIRITSEFSPAAISVACKGDDLSVELWQEDEKQLTGTLECLSTYEIPEPLLGVWTLGVKPSSNDGFQISTYTLHVYLVGP